MCTQSTFRLWLKDQNYWHDNIVLDSAQTMKIWSWLRLKVKSKTIFSWSWSCRSMWTQTRPSSGLSLNTTELVSTTTLVCNDPSGGSPSNSAKGVQKCHFEFTHVFYSLSAALLGLYWHLASLSGTSEGVDNDGNSFFLKNKNLVKTMFNSNSVKQQPRPKELRIAISNDAFIGDTFMCNSIWICQITIYVPCYLFSLLSGLLRLTFSERGLCVRQITEEYSRWRSAAIAKSHFYILKNKTFLETKWIAQFMSQDFSCTKSHFTFIGY